MCSHHIFTRFTSFKSFTQEFHMGKTNTHESCSVIVPHCQQCRWALGQSTAHFQGKCVKILTRFGTFPKVKVIVNLQFEGRVFTIDQKTAMINCIFDHCCSAQLVIILGTIGGCETSAAHMVLRPLVHWESSTCLHHIGTLDWCMLAS